MEWEPNRIKIAKSAGYFNGVGIIYSYTVTNKNQPNEIRIGLTIEQGDNESLREFLCSVGISPEGNPRELHAVQIRGFEKLQSTIAILWPYLNRVRKDRYVKVVRNYYENLSRAGIIPENNKTFGSIGESKGQFGNYNERREQWKVSAEGGREKTRRSKRNNS